jgi:hypothetical protein
MKMLARLPEGVRSAILAQANETAVEGVTNG